MLELDRVVVSFAQGGDVIIGVCVCICIVGVVGGVFAAGATHVDAVALPVVFNLVSQHLVLIVSIDEVALELDELLGLEVHSFEQALLALPSEARRIFNEAQEKR